MGSTDPNDIIAGMDSRYDHPSQRPFGALLAARKYTHVPKGAGEAWTRLNAVLYALWDDPDIGPEFEASVIETLMAWKETYPVMNPATILLAQACISKYLLTPNPTLARYFLLYFLRRAEAAEASVDWATERLDVLGRDPTSLGKPATRAGRTLHQAIRTRKKEAGMVRLDIAALIRQAEVWVRVRHGLVPSLRAYVDSYEARPYERDDIDPSGPDTDNRYREWRRDLKRLDHALRRKDWGDLPI